MFYPASLAWLLIMKKCVFRCATAPFVSLSKSRLRLLSLSSLPVVSDSSSKKYASHSFTPVLRKRKIGRKLRSYEYFLVMLRSTGACIFLYKKRKLKKNYRDFYISLDILWTLWYYYRRKWNVSKMDGVLRVLGMSVANDAKLFRTPQFQEM